MELLSFENWGSPHGIAGHISSLCPDKATEEARKILFYRVGLSIRGGYFELLKEPHHTNEDVENAKRWLRINHDVVSIQIVQSTCKSKNNSVSLERSKQQKINNLWDN